jgi:hypothetical protein
MKKSFYFDPCKKSNLHKPGMVYTTVIPALWRQRQEYCELEGSLGDKVRLSQKRTTKIKFKKGKITCSNLMLTNPFCKIILFPHFHLIKPF